MKFDRVLLATIRYFGGCPCPRCLVQKSEIADMGSKRDMSRRADPRYMRSDTNFLRRKIELVRKWIFEKGIILNGTAVEGLLFAESLVPTRVSVPPSAVCHKSLILLLQNAFSKLREHGLNFFSMFVPDFLHEFELGTWKSIFTHLIRILHEVSPEAITNLNER